MKRTYEKPVMNSVNIQNNEKIATNCWHNEANSGGKTWYYDPNGIKEKGYIEFTLSADCSGNAGTLTKAIPMNYPEGTDTSKIIENLRGRLKDDLKFNLANSKDIYDDPTKVS